MCCCVSIKSGPVANERRSSLRLELNRQQEMFKYLTAFVAVAACATVWAQTVDPLPNQQVLDPNFVLSWGLDEAGDSITIEFLYNSNGWGCVYLLSDDGSLLDVWWGGFDEDYGVPYLQDGYSQLDGLAPGPRYPDTFQNLNRLLSVQPPFASTTRLRFSRLLDSKDRVDVPITPGVRQVVLWAYADNDIASTPAVQSGIAYVTFLP